MTFLERAIADGEGGEKVDTSIGAGAPDLKTNILRKAGYHVLLADRFPFCESVGQCGSKEGALLLGMEADCLEKNPEEFSLPRMQRNIPGRHFDRMRQIWEKKEEVHRGWIRAAWRLTCKWHSVPACARPEVETALAGIRSKIREDLYGAVLAIVTPATASTELDQWKGEEKGLREEFRKCDQNTLLMERLWLDALLEKSKRGSSGIPVFDLEPEVRQRMAIRRRRLQLVDISHQGMGIAKAIHHTQEKAQLRKTEQMPVVAHPIQVLLTYLFYVVAHVIDEEKNSHNFILGCLAAAAHDLVEDSGLDMDEILEFIVTRVNHYDSSLNQKIKSGVPSVTSKMFKERVLDLVDKEVQEQLVKILKILSKNAVLTDAEKKKGLQKNACGQAKTPAALGLQEQGYKHFQVDQDNLPPPLKALQMYPESLEPQEQDLDAFLVRLSTSDAKQTRQIAFIVKLLDRAHNNSTLKGRRPETQRGNLRSTVTRLVAPAMLDTGGTILNFEMYNALPHLIDVTLKEYNRFENEFAELMEPKDHAYMCQLQTWQSEVKRYELPANIKQMISGYEQAQAAQAST